MRVCVCGGGGCERVYVPACVCACVRACARACVCGLGVGMDACVWVGAFVLHALKFDNNYVMYM